VACSGLVFGEPAVAQPPPPALTREPADRVKPAAIPPAPDSVEQIASAAYLSPDQLKDKRIFFGRYGSDDIDTPARAARVALLRAQYDDPALTPDAADADPLDRAEAALLRGDLPAALRLLDAPDQPAGLSPRAVRIRAAVLELQGRFADAARVAEPVLAALNARTLSSADDITEAVMLAAQRLRLTGPGSPKDTTAADYKALLKRLDDVVNTVDRLSWPTMLAQAELLAEHDNKQEAAQTLQRAIALNPACARAWALLGRNMVDGFMFGQVETIAKRLDLLAGGSSASEDPDTLPPEVEAADPGAVSPEGAILIARILLRQSEGAQAVTILAPHIARFPRSPRLLALNCAALAVSFDFAAADKALAEFDALFNQSPLAHYETGRALSESRQYAQSRAHLDEAAKRQPNAAEPYIELGLMLMQAGKDDDALRALERAFALDPFNVRADNSLRLARELRTYERVETPHFIIRSKPGPSTDGGVGDALLAREMAAPLERNYAIDTGSGPGGIDYQPKDKTLIDLMPDHQWFGVRIAGMPAIHTIAASTGPVIAMESPRDGANHLGTYDWVRVLRHEFTHTVNLGRTNNRIPHWFTEASAVYLEQAPRDWSTCQLLAAAHRQNTLFDFTEINLAFVRPKKPIDRSQAYAQGHWMYEYIIERAGPRAPLDLMDKYAAGVREEEAFQSVLSVSRAQFLADFLAWSRQQLIDWGLDVPDGTPIIRQLQAREALAQNPGGHAGAADAERALALKRIADGHPTDADDDIDLPVPSPEQIAKWLAEHPRHPDVLELALDEALGKHAGKAVPEIVDLVERYAAARPVDPKPHRLLAQMYLAAADSNPADLLAQAAKAIPHLEFLDRREQKVPTYAMELARRHAALGDLDKAQSSAERATQIDPFNPRPRELAATIAVQAKNYPAAERHITALTLIEPTQEIHKKRLEALAKLREQPAR
jgi:tetratricopeptide (TPR) repeat protein